MWIWKHVLYFARSLWGEGYQGSTLFCWGPCSRGFTLHFPIWVAIGLVCQMFSSPYFVLCLLRSTVGKMDFSKQLTLDVVACGCGQLLSCAWWLFPGPALKHFRERLVTPRNSSRVMLSLTGKRLKGLCRSCTRKKAICLICVLATHSLFFGFGLTILGCRMFSSFFFASCCFIVVLVSRGDCWLIPNYS